jgi:uncharacterized protein
MSDDVLSAIANEVLNSPLVGSSIDVIWHSGEPLMAGKKFFERAMASFTRNSSSVRQINHFIQTNATLVDAEWCELFLRWNISVGVSLDGPAFLHDMCRKTRSGRKTHWRAMQGIAALKSSGFPISAICVVHNDSLSYPREIIDFFLENGVVSVGFNVEQIEGDHPQSTVLNDIGWETNSSLAKFWEELYECWKPVSDRICIREFANIEKIAACRCTDSLASLAPFNSSPNKSITISKNGDMFPFSPEIASLPPVIAGSWCLGNVREKSFQTALLSEKAAGLSSEVKQGVDLCNSTCGLFNYCGAQFVSNKIAEHGTASAAETRTCFANLQIPAMVALRRLANEI